VPGDKSLSHRAVLFSAMAEGRTRLSGVLDSADVRSSISAVEALGAGVDLAEQPDGSLAGSVAGWGSRGPTGAGVAIDCGNSGTTARLLMGVLAGWPLEVTLTGDESLSRRPMLRVTTPLSAMGASFEATAQGTLPVVVRGTARPLAIEYDSPVASAQVKSAVLLAGLRAHGTTCVTEPALSRDHTERMLGDFAVDVSTDGTHLRACVGGPATLLCPGELFVPRDPSSAAFITVAALLVPESEVLLPGISLNPTRVGFLRVLERMGARLTVTPSGSASSEPDGAVSASYSASLKATVVRADEIPSLVDEVPILALAAACAEGETRFEGVGELRVKESDRLAAIAEGLGALGVETAVHGDVLVVRGARSLRGAALDSLGDHRLAMTWAVAGLVATDPVEIERFEAVDVSYPRFAGDLAALAG
jgi:3-phosphoshikimate 1-carboxyvinyltransferase